MSAEEVVIEELLTAATNEDVTHESGSRLPNNNFATNRLVLKIFIHEYANHSTTSRGKIRAARKLAQLYRIYALSSSIELGLEQAANYITNPTISTGFDRLGKAAGLMGKVYTGSSIGGIVGGPVGSVVGAVAGVVFWKVLH